MDGLTKVSCYCVLYVGEVAEVAALLIWMMELAKRRRILALLLIARPRRTGRCEEVLFG